MTGMFNKTNERVGRRIECLDELIERARAHIITDDEKRAQAISFAYGNVKLHNPSVTREMVERGYDLIEGERRSRLTPLEFESWQFVLEVLAKQHPDELVRKKAKNYRHNLLCINLVDKGKTEDRLLEPPTWWEMLKYLWKRLFA